MSGFIEKIDPTAAEWRQPVADVFNTLDGSVQSQGVRVDARAWLDMGSKSWSETDDKTRARAYQAAKVTGWSDDALIAIMVESLPHLDQDIMEYTVGMLHDLDKKYPAKIEDVYEPKIECELKKD